MILRRCSPLTALRAALIAVVLLSAAAFALVADDRGPTYASAQRALPWADCGAPHQCATLRVPLDYGNPGSRTIELALVRIPARDASKRVGSLLVNPGGPGASGVEFARAIAPAFPAAIRDRFDIVGFDPRGVAASTPLLCHDNIQALAASEPEPTNEDQWAEAIRVTRDFAALCGQRGGDLLAHLGSLDVVRDMDRIREAVGDEKLTYVGYSYGTLLGELYADRFPTRVRALVLDGPIDPALTADEATAQQAIGFERAIDGFNASCRSRSCPLSDGGKEPWSAIQELVDQARTNPIPAPGTDRPAGAGEIMLGAFQALYRPFTWRTLERAVTEARDGDASPFIRLADQYLGRRLDGYSNQLEMNAAVNCLDYEFSHDLAHYRALSDALVPIAPRIGRVMAAGGLGCALWPTPPQPVDVSGATGAPPVLIVGTTNDPATPFEWAIAARKALPSGVLLTHEGDGHTVYLSGVRCVDDVVNAYLLNGTTPQDGAICGHDADPPRPAPTAPAQAVVPTPVLRFDRTGAGSAASASSTPRPPATGTGPAQSVAPSAAADTTLERGAETAIALRLLAVAVLASIVAVIVVTRRRIMRP